MVAGWSSTARVSESPALSRRRYSFSWSARSSTGSRIAGAARWLLTATQPGIYQRQLVYPVSSRLDRCLLSMGLYDDNSSGSPVMARHCARRTTTARPPLEAAMASSVRLGSRSKRYYDGGGSTPTTPNSTRRVGLRP